MPIWFVYEVNLNFIMDKNVAHQKLSAAPAALFTLTVTPQVLLMCHTLCKYMGLQCAPHSETFR